MIPYGPFFSVHSAKGYYDIMRDVDISFDVLPDRFSHDGPLFSIGTEDFQYYEWKTKAFETQYFVIEFVYSAVSWYQAISPLSEISNTL